MRIFIIKYYFNHDGIFRKNNNVFDSNDGDKSTLLVMIV